MTQTTDSEILTFRLSFFYRGILHLLVLGTILLGGWGAYYFLTNNGPILLAVLFGGGGLLLGGLMFLAGRCRLEVGPSEIRYTELRKTKSLPLDAIAGFRIVPTQYVKLLLIEPRDPHHKKMKVGLILERQKELLAWFKANLTDLDQADYQQGLMEIYQNENLQGTPEEKAARYQQAQKWCKVFRWTATGVCFWGILFPQPYPAAIGAALALPFLGLLMLRRFEGIAQFNAKKKGARPGVDVAIIMPCATLGLRAINDWHFLEWPAFWAPFAAISLALLGFALLAVKEIRQKALSVLLMALFAAAYGAGATANLNGVLADGKVSLYRAKVVQKHASSGRNTTYYLTVSPWLNRESRADAVVSRAVYERHQPGDTAEIFVRAGKFGIPFYFVQ